MNIIIKKKNLEINELLKSTINRKIGGLKKFLDKFKTDKNVSFDAFVYVGKETMHHKKGDIFETEVKIVLPKKNFIAKYHGENLLKTITEVKKELEREIRKYKTKIVELPRRKYKKIKNKIKFDN